MTPADITLIRSQFASLKGAEEAVAAAFYARLFEIAPTVRRMFPLDLTGQGKKLMTTLAFAINSLDRPETLQPAVFALGASHARYGVTADQFAPVGAALLDTLAAGLGAGFDQRARTAWTAAYSALAGMMAEGLASASNKAA